MRSLRRRVAIALLLALALTAPALALTPDQWRADLDYLSTELPRRHSNLFANMTREQFEGAVADLRQRIPGLSDQAVTAGLMHIVAMVRDAHTSLSPAYRSVPVMVRWFPEGLFVTAAAAEYRRALGAKVVGIGDATTEAVHEILRGVVSHENEQWLRAWGPRFMLRPELLYGLGVNASTTALRLTLEDARGERFTLDTSLMPSTMLTDLPDPALGVTPLWLRKVNVNYWFEPLPGAKLIYVAYNMCGEADDLPFATFAQQLSNAIDANAARGLIVDLRNNTGGSTNVIRPLLQLIAGFRDPASSVTVLIGGTTFSAGMYAAAQLAEEYGLTLIGEPTGGKPNSYGNITTFRLPNSGLSVTHSTKHVVHSTRFTGDSVTPDVAVSTTAADYFGRNDPVLTAALIRPARYRAPQRVETPPAVVSAASFGGPVSPGSLASVFGSFPGVLPAGAASLPLPTEMGGVQVKVGGVAAPLLAVGPGQINFQVPGATALGAAEIMVLEAGREIASGAMEVAAASPGVFLSQRFGEDAIVIYATGAGALTTPVADGAAAPSSPLAETVNKPRVFVGTEEATVLFSGMTPGLAGLWQINARVPNAASMAGQTPVVVVAPDGRASNAVTTSFD
jgi:uncharacterized protein (TIGR03437 family)